MRSFGHLEHEIMRVIWGETSPMTGHEIAERIAPARPIAYTTILTVLDRLREKGYLERSRHGRSYRFRAVTTEEDYASALMQQVLHTAEDRPAALLRFAGRLEPEEAAALRAALNASEKPNPSSRP